MAAEKQNSLKGIRLVYNALKIRVSVLNLNSNIQLGRFHSDLQDIKLKVSSKEYATSRYTKSIKI